MYDQKIILKLNSQQKELLSNRIYEVILRSMRDNPRTIDEINEFLGVEGISKSKKSLYRYINTLVKSGLAILAGKRIIVRYNLTQCPDLQPPKLGIIVRFTPVPSRLARVSGNNCSGSGLGIPSSLAARTPFSNFAVPAAWRNTNNCSVFLAPDFPAASKSEQKKAPTLVGAFY